MHSFERVVSPYLFPPSDFFNSPILSSSHNCHLSPVVSVDTSTRDVRTEFNKASELVEVLFLAQYRVDYSSNILLLYSLSCISRHMQQRSGHLSATHLLPSLLSNSCSVTGFQCMKRREGVLLQDHSLLCVCVISCDVFARKQAFRL